MRICRPVSFERTCWTKIRRWSSPSDSSPSKPVHKEGIMSLGRKPVGLASASSRASDSLSSLVAAFTAAAYQPWILNMTSDRRKRRSQLLEQEHCKILPISVLMFSIWSWTCSKFGLWVEASSFSEAVHASDGSIDSWARNRRVRLRQWQRGTGRIAVDVRQSSGPRRMLGEFPSELDDANLASV